MQRTRHEVIVNWNSARSIAKAERDKQRFENRGLVPIKTVSTADGAVITYAQPQR